MIARNPAPEEPSPEQEPAAPPTAAALAREIAFRLEVNRQLGWSVPLASELRSPGRRSTGSDRTDQGAAVSGSVAAERERRQALLDEMDREVSACTRCPLHSGRTRTVFGVGDPCARLLFVGEGPGYDEDRQGEPFVGKAGRLLDRMILAMGLERSAVYIANIVKCRPPGNRNPEPPEIRACLPYLHRQIEIIRPEVICTLGTTPLRALLGASTGITRARGQLFRHEGIPAVPTFHPAYLLRNAAAKRPAWADLQKVMGFLGLPVS